MARRKVDIKFLGVGFKITSGIAEIIILKGLYLNTV